MRGSGTSDVEVISVAPHGLTLRLGHEVLHLAFADFPWFRDATIAQLSEVTRPSDDHLYWPQLDIDLSVASVRNPADFPLVSREHVPGAGRVAEDPPATDLPGGLSPGGR